MTFTTPKNSVMRKLLTIVLVFCELALCAQTKLPVIKATSISVNIREGKKLVINAWRISPNLRPDVFTTPLKHGRVTFYTDCDSISFKVRPGKTWNFVILLKGKDSAFTQVKYAPGNPDPDFLDILKKGGKYNNNDKREILRFTYEADQNPDLVKIRMQYNLDSVAGEGSEISKILNLMHWVHNSFVYDGTKELPEYVGTADLISKCIHGKGTMHCAALAWVLNDCYLAMGFRSRHVVCLPKDSADFDCHSINTVFSKTLNKWLWIDPTNDAYVMNEKGELLSIAEVRERLVSNKSLILNPDANINHRYSVGIENYLYGYMAKNLYAFQCYVTPVNGSQSNVLLPVEYKGIIPRTKMNKPKCTNNPGVFWAKPE
jgi:hypothetical protein